MSFIRTILAMACCFSLFGGHPAAASDGTRPVPLPGRPKIGNSHTVIATRTHSPRARKGNVDILGDIARRPTSTADREPVGRTSLAQGSMLLPHSTSDFPNAVNSAGRLRGHPRARSSAGSSAFTRILTTFLPPRPLLSRTSPVRNPPSRRRTSESGRWTWNPRNARLSEGKPLTDEVMTPNRAGRADDRRTPSRSRSPLSLGIPTRPIRWISTMISDERAEIRRLRLACR